jgi:S-DNA-T family DNA segregation ATPase FtsK/SpoIIIE
MDSRAVLGVPDAHELPRSPGHGYLKAGTEGMIRFRAAYVSGTYRHGVTHQAIDPGATGLIREYRTQYVATLAETTAPVDAAPPVEPEGPRGETLLDVLVARMEGNGPPAHQVWLPPLTDPPTLDQLLPPAGTPSPVLHGVVGIVDKPYEQRREPLWLDLSGGAGNAIVVGGPQTGKSNLLRTLVASLAVSHTPLEVQFYCLDFGGGALTGLRDLPHVGGVAVRRDVNRVRRTIAELIGILTEREARFAAEGIDGMATYRRARRAGRFADDPFGDVFLVVDGWSTLRTEFEDLEPLVTELSGRGLGYGIHVLASAGRWMEVRPAQRDGFAAKMELRLGETSDSVINRRAASSVPEQTPGRGLTPDGFHFLAGLPRLDGRQTAEDLAEGLAGLVASVRAGWTGPPAPAVRLLPDQLPYSAIAGAHIKSQLAIGIAESDLAPVRVDFDAEPHLLLLGDVECGKSSFLRGLAQSITDTFPPDQARVIAVDYRRSLLGSIQPSHLLGSGSSLQITTDLIKQAVTVMRERLPGPDVTPEQLRTRSWWKGPQLFVLVDDYDLVAASAANPLAPLLEFLAQGRDIGLHVIITRRVGGASRAMFDPILARIRELASPGILMSGPKEEGALFGTVKPQILPPGRGWLITRRQGARLIQLPWIAPAS